MVDFGSHRTTVTPPRGPPGHPNPLGRGMGRGAIRRPCPHYGSTGNCYNMVPLPSCASWARGRPIHHIITIPSWWQNGCMRCLIKLLHLKHKWCRVGPYGGSLMVRSRRHLGRSGSFPCQSGSEWLRVARSGSGRCLAPAAPPVSLGLRTRPAASPTPPTA